MHSHTQAITTPTRKAATNLAKEVARQLGVSGTLVMRLPCLALSVGVDHGVVRC